MVSQAQELPAGLPLSVGKWEQALGRSPGTEMQKYPGSSGSRAGLQLPKQQMQPLPGCQILVSCGGWSHEQLCADPVAITSWTPTDNSSVWHTFLCLFMALFSLINPELVTFSSA